MGKMIFGVLGFVLALTIFFMYTKPAYSSIQEVQAQIAQYDDALAKAAQLQELKQKLLSRYNSFNPDDINRLQIMIPDHVDNIGLILELDNIASRYGMALENVDVSSASPQSQAVGGDVIGGSHLKHDSLTLDFSTFGTYANFLTFMQDLESSLRVVDLVSLTLNQDTATKGEPAYHFDVSIRTYWLK